MADRWASRAGASSGWATSIGVIETNAVSGRSRALASSFAWYPVIRPAARAGGPAGARPRPTGPPVGQVGVAGPPVAGQGGQQRPVDVDGRRGAGVSRGVRRAHGTVVQVPDAVVGADDDVLDAGAPPARQVDARLDAERHPRLAAAGRCRPRCRAPRGSPARCRGRCGARTARPSRRRRSPARGGVHLLRGHPGRTASTAACARPAGPRTARATSAVGAPPMM